MDITPDKQQTLARVNRISSMVGSTLAKATRDAGNFFSDGKPFSANLFADLARYYAHYMFRTDQLDTEDDDDFSMEAHTVANIGLQLYSDGVLFKILRFGPNQTVPVPQTSARIQFYNQQLSTISDTRTDSLRMVTLNLLYLWDCGSDHAVSRFLLVCPKSAGNSKSSIETYWTAELDVPSLEPEQKQTREERADLNIRKKSIGEASPNDFPAKGTGSERQVAQDDSDLSHNI
jgi:hypothetical protein